MSSSSPALPFQGRQGFNLGLYPLEPFQPPFHSLRALGLSLFTLQVLLAWEAQDPLGDAHLATNTTDDIPFSKPEKKEERKKGKKKKRKNDKTKPKTMQKTHTTPVGHRLLFKETFLPNYLKASSATWWWHPPWPAHPPTVCLWGGGSAPHPALLPPSRRAAQAGGWAGGAAHCLYPPLFLSLVFRASSCVGRGEPAVQSGPRCPPIPGGPFSRCLRPRFSHRMFYRIVHMV